MECSVYCFGNMRLEGGPLGLKLYHTHIHTHTIISLSNITLSSSDHVLTNNKL